MRLVCTNEGGLVFLYLMMKELEETGSLELTCLRLYFEVNFLTVHLAELQLG